MASHCCCCIATCATAQDYKIAQPGYTFAFPRDYFNHEDYQTEWWYYTGNVKSADGHRFGFELTFFRQGVSRAECRPMVVHDLWMAHMALSDISGQHFYSEERLNRSGPGIAGVDRRRRAGVERQLAGAHRRAAKRTARRSRQVWVCVEA